MKIRIILLASVLLAVSLGVFISCKKESANEKLNGVFIVPQSGSSVVENRTLLSYVTTPYKFPFAAAMIAPMPSNVDVKIVVDNSLVGAYNTAQRTNYATLPTGSYSLETSSLTIPKDSLVSQQTNVVINATMLTTDVSYLLPVKVESVSSDKVTLNSALATKYYIVRAPKPVIGNLSDGKPASKNGPSASPAARGNDGNTDGNWNNSSVCETGAVTEGYWDVDLGAISPRIDTIRIWNRTDCCDDRTTDFYIFVSDVPFSGTTVASSVAQPRVYKYFNAGKAGRPTTVLPNVSGRYIRLQNTGGTSLTLAELTAIGIKP
jgi:hypothetical protein